MRRSAGLGFALAPPLLLYGSLLVGRIPLHVGEVNAALAALLGGHAAGDLAAGIVQELRLPRGLLALLIGGGLSVAGAAYQGLFRNPLVSPDVLGATPAAGFGAALALLLGAGPFGLQGVAFGCGLLGVMLSYGLARRCRGSSVLLLVLAGIVVGAFFTALLGGVKVVADPESRLPAITYWLLGSLASASGGTLLVGAVPIAAGSLVLLLLGWRLNALALGDDEARTLGIRIESLRAVVIAAATLVTATAVALCGIVGWVGLVIPHAARLLVGADHRRLLPAALSLGGCYLLIVDTLARSVIAAEIPLGVLTALIGAPACAWLVLRTRYAWS